MSQRPLILQLLNAAAGKDCSKEPDEIAEDEAYLLMSKHGAGDSTSDSDWAQWEGGLLKLVPQMETVDTLRAMKVFYSFFKNVFLWVFVSAICKHCDVFLGGERALDRDAVGSPGDPAKGLPAVHGGCAHAQP